MGTEPSTTVRSRAARPWGWLGVALPLTSVVLAGLATWGARQFGSVGGALAFLNGDRLIPDAYAKSFGIGEVGSSPRVVFNLANKSARPIKVVGARSSCTCMALDGLPATVEAGSSLELRVDVQPADKPRRVAGTVIVYSDCEEQPYVSLSVSGQFADRGPLARSPTAAKRQQ